MNKFNFKGALENLTLSTLTKEDLSLMTPPLDDALPNHGRRNNLRGAVISVQSSMGGRKRNVNRFHTQTDFKGAASHT
jgi:hypothetical protein